MVRAQSGIEALIRARASENPDETWLKWRGSETSWRESLSNIQRAANGLLELGVEPGDRVAIMMANRPEFLWVHFAAGFIGAYSVPVNISQRGTTLAHILADSGATAVVYQGDLSDVIGAARSSVPGLRLGVVVDGAPAPGGADWDIDRLLSGADREPDVEVAEAPSGAAIMYTSGTTGPPKGVVPRAGRDAGSVVSVLLDATGVREGDTIYTALPLFHGNALGVSTVGSIVRNAKLALAPRFSASRFWEECRDTGAVETNTLGGMISILLKQPPRASDREHGVRAVLSAGCPPERWREFEQRFGVEIVEWYGMVDSPGFLLNHGGPVGSMGRPVTGIEFRVVDDEDDDVAPGEVGELVFRHPEGQLTEYNNLPDATATAYRDGWFHSGDLASVDADGWFWFKGRKKESMRRLGENISAWEIENVVNAHPGVVESAAHAVRSDLGEDEVKIVVVPAAGSDLRPEQIVDFCVGRMAHYAVPRYVELVDEIPKTATQRVRYAELKAAGITEGTWDRIAAGHAVERR
ncbi:MAG TPA: AMP-binding protein [Acidimicrobiales bacterium]|nr:AMP-binding protein [Acidimicrobiales bacterium]